MLKFHEPTTEPMDWMTQGSAGHVPAIGTQVRARPVFNGVEVGAFGDLNDEAVAGMLERLRWMLEHRHLLPNGPVDFIHIGHSAAGTWGPGWASRPESRGDPMELMLAVVSYLERKEAP